MILVCLVILQEQVIKGSCDFMGTSPSMWVIILSQISFMYLLPKFRGLEKTGDVNPYINSYMDILYRGELTA